MCAPPATARSATPFLTPQDLMSRRVSSNRARLNGSEAKAAVLIGWNAAKPDKRTFERLTLRLVGVPTVAVRLPKLKNRVRHRYAVSISDASRDFDDLTRGIRAGQIIPI